MFCSKCGNQLKDGDRFCAKCGASVLQQTEPQEKPAAEPVYSQVPVEGRAEVQTLEHRVAASVQKKSKKGLIIGLSVGGALLAVILAAALIFVFALKGGSSKGDDSSVNLGYSTVVYDDQYTYFLSETETWAPCIKRVSNDLSGQPEILYESEEFEGDGWSMYPMHCMFLWNDKICFIEYTNYTEQGDEEFEIHWLSKNGKENGTLVSYEQLNTYGDLLSQMEGAYFFNDYLIFGNRFSFYRLDLNTGELCRQEDFLDLEGPACFVAYQNGYYYYFVPDMENNIMGETLYRKAVNSEAAEIGKVPSQGNDDVGKYFSFIPKGDYLYYADLDNIYRLNIEDGSTETLASYERTYNRFTMCENGLYYFKDMTLRFLNTETMEETVFDEVERIPAFIYAGANDSCWMQGDATSHRYNCFRPDKQGESFIYFGESDQDASIDHQETVNTAELYADVIDRTIAEHGALWFDEVEYECCARGVFKIDLMDFNQDGTKELVMLYNNRESIFPFVDVWTVKNGEAVQLFCERQQEENHEAAISSRIYQNGGNLYVPVYDSLNNFPMYVHLYGFDENGEFGEVYQYENNAFYMNQLPDDMEFTEYSSVQFYVCDRVADYGAQKNLMKESLQTDMEDILKRLELTVPENSSTQTSQSEFDITSMLGEWTLEVAQPNTENVSRHVIRLRPDGIMDLQAEDGSWLNYTYTMDQTHFYFTYEASGITSGGTYIVSEGKIILSIER